MTEKPTYEELKKRIQELEHLEYKLNKAEEALEESEGRYRAVVDDMPGLICSFLPSGEIIYVNKSYCEHFNKTLEELVGTNFLSLIPDSEQKAVMENISALTVESPTQSHEHPVIAPNGDIRWQRWTNRALFDDQGNTIGYQSIGIDITDRKQAENALHKTHHELQNRDEDRTAKLSEANRLLNQEFNERIRIENALRKSEKRYRIVSELTTDFAYAFRVENEEILSLEWVTEAIDRITGFTFNELRSRGGWQSIVHPNDRSIVKDQLKALLRGQSNIVQYRIYNSKGEIRWLRDYGRPGLVQRHGRVTHIYGAVQDITKQKRAENALQASEQKYRLLVENANEGIAVAQDGQMKFVNPKLLEITGYSEQELKSLPFINFVHPEDHKVVIDHHSRKLENPNVPNSYTVKIIHKSGKVKWIENNGVGITWEGKPATLNFVTDITEKRLFERQIIQKEKMASLGVLVSSIAHEINNPNNFVSFNIPILKDYIEEIIPIMDEYADKHPDFEICNLTYPEFRQDIFKLIANIENGSDRISFFVSNLRRFSQDEHKKPMAWVDLKVVIESVHSICHSKIKSSVKSFVKYIPPDLPQIYTEPYALEQILLNLLVNAAQAANKHDSWIKLKVIVNNGEQEQIGIEVSDNGCGIDEETQLKMFDPMFTTKSQADGTGLGLYVCLTLVERLDGRIEVESEPGEGSKFRLILPLKTRN